MQLTHRENLIAALRRQPCERIPFHLTMCESLQQEMIRRYGTANAVEVFDMPLDEFCFLQVVGRFIHGKVDSKYIVGCIPNINGANKHLQMSDEEINKAPWNSQGASCVLSLLLCSMRFMQE